MSDPETVFYYDGECGMCVSFVRLLGRFDGPQRITWTAYQSLDAPPAGLSWDDLDRAAYLMTNSGELHKGYFAIGALLTRIDRLAVVATLMSVPGSSWLGQAIYSIISRNRRRLPFCRTAGPKT